MDEPRADRSAAVRVRKQSPDETDCYALGMVVYETISGRRPFYQHGDMTALVKVLDGEHPLRGAGFTDSLWKMLERCWTSRPNSRPSIEDVLRCLEDC